MGVIYCLSLKVLLSKVEILCGRHLYLMLLDREEGLGWSPLEFLHTKRRGESSRRREKGRDRQEAESPRERGKPRKEFERMSNADVRDDLRLYRVSTSVEPHKGRLRRGRGERSAAVDGPGENSLAMQPRASRFQQHADLFKAVPLCALCM